MIYAHSDITFCRVCYNGTYFFIKFFLFSLSVRKNLLSLHHVKLLIFFIMYYVKQTSKREGKVSNVTLLSSERLDVCLSVFQMLNESVVRLSKGDVKVVNRITDGNTTLYRMSFDIFDNSNVE